jgi:hypothetical protein
VLNPRWIYLVPVDWREGIAVLRTSLNRVGDISV